MKSLVKIILAILLLLALLHLPYGYYRFLRLAVTAAFIYLATVEFKAKKDVLGLALIAAAILFNPIIKVPFPRHTWNVIDAITAILLLIWFFTDKKNYDGR